MGRVPKDSRAPARTTAKSGTLHGEARHRELMQGGRGRGHDQHPVIEFVAELVVGLSAVCTAMFLWDTKVPPSAAAISHR